MIPLLRHEERVSHKGVQRGMVATQEDYREEAKFREVRLVILRATSRLRSFAVTHLTITDGAAKRLDLGESSRGEKNLQDINADRFTSYPCYPRHPWFDPSWHFARPCKRFDLPSGGLSRVVRRG
jgi:hypothetical protein